MTDYEDRIKDMANFFAENGDNIYAGNMSFSVCFRHKDIGVVQYQYSSLDEILASLMIMIDGVYKNIKEELNIGDREEFIKMISAMYMLTMDTAGFGDKGDRSSTTIKMPRKFSDKANKD